MSEQARFIETSPWIEAPADRQAPLAASTGADVVIVGGGYTGLATALSLRRQGADVVLLEEGFAGSGASGRNAGHLTPTIGKDLPSLLRFFGRERARALVRFADAAVDHTSEIIRKHEIECDYLASGNLLAGLHPKHEGRLRATAEAARGLGAEVRFLSSGELRERAIPPAFQCAVLEEKGGTLHPGRYVAGLRDAALRAGVRIFEDTRVQRLEDGATVRAHTEGGEVTAPHAVLATNAYTKSLGRRRRHVVPVRVSLFESEVIDDETARELGWSGREGIYTAHEILESYRLTARRTIVGGSKLVRYRYASELAPGHDPEAFRVIEGAFRERFPTLAHVPVAHFWGGWIGLTFDFLPQIGSEGAQQNIHYGVGFNGHGVAQATLVGSMLAQRCLGALHEYDAALERRLWAWPPEPLRWLASKLLTGALTMVDARTDRQIRAAGGAGGKS